jgi:hypothetical protein
MDCLKIPAQVSGQIFKDDVNGFSSILDICLMPEAQCRTSLCAVMLLPRREVNLAASCLLQSFQLSYRRGGSRAGSSYPEAESKEKQGLWDPMP